VLVGLETVDGAGAGDAAGDDVVGAAAGGSASVVGEHAARLSVAARARNRRE
jgi:hypothetical protein